MTNRFRRAAAALTLTGALSAAFVGAAGAADPRDWDAVRAAARGQTVFWNAWAGDERTNAFIAWVGEETRARFGVSVVQVKLKDTAEAVTRVVAEKTAGRHAGGSVDLIWINGPNFLSMKNQGVLHGPFADALPNFRFVDTTTKRSNVIDFTVPVEGYASPWRMAQIVFVYDQARLKPADLPRSMRAMAAWAKANPGRLTHPNVRNFLGSTFLKQALYELAPDPAALQRPADDAAFVRAAEPLWAWYNGLCGALWRGGRSFPESGPAMRQLLNDGEIDLMISFNPAEAAVSIAGNLLPGTARVYTLDSGTIGNTSFVAIPYNAAHKEGAMVVADFLLSAEAQARAQDPRVLGNVTVLDLGRLPEAERRRFAGGADAPGLPASEELGPVLLEPHPSWMTRLVEEWERRTTR